ncbi:nuclear pore complex protein nup205 [Anaeramoeba flamelloides]|uniref:Nuclear pore complex protein nup205 n=1 Tax=Anaeramoeba flamelloides TaxID=1746091 RepID=A0AAV7YBH6_9EUKA|nr:nuclear pore complex protein nup205 [Anaeramoeba flamelloides]
MTYAGLRQTLNYTLSKHIPIQTLNKTLQSFQNKLQNPLTDNPPKREDRLKVESGEVYTIGTQKRLTEETIKIILNASKILQLNEIDTFQLLDLAEEYQQQVQVDLQTAIIDVYHQERINQLSCLLELITSQKNDQIEFEIKKLTTQFITTLLENNVFQNVCEKIVFFLKKINSIDERQRSYLCTEIKMLSKIIFFLFYQNEISLENIKTVKNILKDMPETLVPTTQIILEKEDQEKLEKIPYFLFFGLSSQLLELPMVILHNYNDLEQINSQLRTNHKFQIDMAKEFLNEKWNNIGFHSGLSFIWMLFLASLKNENYKNVCQQLLEFSLQNDAFGFFSKIIENSHKKKKSKFFVSILDELVCFFILELTTEVRSMKEKEIENERNTLNYFEYSYERKKKKKKEIIRKDFERLLNFMKHLYTDQPELSLKFLDGKLKDFIVFSGESPTISLYVSYVEMFTALVNNRECAKLASKFLESERNRIFFWPHFFEVIEKYKIDLLQSNNRGKINNKKTGNSNNGNNNNNNKNKKNLQLNYNNKINLLEEESTDINGLIVILKLITRIVSQDESSRTMLIIRSKWGYLYSLFNFYVQELPSLLKSELLNTITAFSYTPEISQQIWFMVEESEILQSGGLKNQLENVESPSKSYPELISFLKLIYTLLIHNKIPTGLKRGIFPYIEFLFNEVFLKFDKRQYNDMNEAWTIVSICLKIFYFLLSKYQVSSDDFLPETLNSEQKPGYYLFLKIIQGKSLFKKISQILDFALEECYIVGQGFEKRLDSLVENCIEISTKMINLVFLKQNLFLEKNRISNKPQQLITFEKIIFQNKSIALNIVIFATYLFNLKILHYSINILYFLTLEPSYHKDFMKIIIESNDNGIISGFTSCLKKPLEEEKNLEEQNVINEGDSNKQIKRGKKKRKKKKRKNQNFNRNQLLNGNISYEIYDDDNDDEFDDDDDESESEFETGSESESEQDNYFFQNKKIEDEIDQIFESEEEREKEKEKEKNKIQEYNNNKHNNYENDEKKVTKKEEEEEEEEEELFVLNFTIREKILKLMITILDNQPNSISTINTLNFCHYLLGFNFKRALRQTQFSQNKISCLNIIFALLKSEIFSIQYPRLSTNCYELIYKLMVHKLTSTPVISYLRKRIGNNEILINQLKYKFFRKGITFLREQSSHYLKLTQNEAENEILQINQKSWILRSIAVELHGGNGRNVPLRSRTEKILPLLFGSFLKIQQQQQQQKQQNNNKKNKNNKNKNNKKNYHNNNQEIFLEKEISYEDQEEEEDDDYDDDDDDDDEDYEFLTKEQSEQQNKIKIIEILENIELNLSEFLFTNELLLTKIDEINRQHLQLDLNSYLIKNEKYSIELFDIPLFKEHLIKIYENYEKKIQDKFVLQEKLYSIKKILFLAIKFNRIQLIIESKFHLFESWKMLVEISLIQRFDHFPKKSQAQSILLLLTTNLLKKKFDFPFLSAMTSDLILSFFMKIKHIINEMIQNDNNEFETNYFFLSKNFILFSNDGLPNMLFSILKAIPFVNSTEKMRGNLYIVLLIFFEILELLKKLNLKNNQNNYSLNKQKSLIKNINQKRHKEKKQIKQTLYDYQDDDDDDDDDDDGYGDGDYEGEGDDINDNSDYSNEEDFNFKNKMKNIHLKKKKTEKMNKIIFSFEKETIKIFKKFDSTLIPILAKDASNNSNLWKCAAFSLLETLLKGKYPNFSPMGKRKEWFKAIEKNGYLQEFIYGILHVQSEIPITLDSVFVFESRLSFLITITQISSKITKSLFNHQIFKILSQLKFQEKLMNQNNKDQNNDQNTFRNLNLDQQQINISQRSLINDHVSFFGIEEYRKKNNFLFFQQNETNTDLEKNPELLSKYNSLLLPILRLILSMCYSLPKDRNLVKSIILFFQNNHHDLIIDLLQNTKYTLYHIHRLYSLTGILKHLAQFPLINKLDNLIAIQNNLLILLKKFSLLHSSNYSQNNNNNSNGISIINNNNNNNDYTNTLKSNNLSNNNKNKIKIHRSVDKLANVILANVISFFQSISTNPNYFGPNLIFTPSITQFQSRNLLTNALPISFFLSFLNSVVKRIFEKDYELTNLEGVQEKNNFEFITICTFIIENSLIIFYNHINYFLNNNIINEQFIKKDRLNIFRLLTQISKLERIKFNENSSALFLRLMVKKIADLFEKF